MEITRFADLKPRTVWEIADDAFDLYRERFLLLASVSAVVLVPALILYSAVVIPQMSNLAHIGDGPRPLSDLSRQLVWVMPLLGLAYFLQGGAIALVVRDTLTGASSDLGSVYKRVFQKFFPLLLAAISIGFITLLSFCTVVGPVFVIPWYVFTPHGILLEDRKLLDSAKRSRDMGSAYIGKTFGMLFLMGVIGAVLSIGLEQLIIAAYTFIPAIQGTGTPYDHETSEKIVATIANAAISLIIAPLPAIATTLLYYDLRVRREGLDIESDATTHGVTLAPDPFGGVLNPKVPKPARRK